MNFLNLNRIYFVKFRNFFRKKRINFYSRKQKSLKKKFKDKKFAAGCSRDVIRRGAEMMGMELNELIGKTILAMQA